MKKKKLKTKTVRCYCCEKLRDTASFQKLLAFSKYRYEENDFLYLKLLWKRVCDHCIMSQKAILANASKQTSFGMKGAFFAYIDENHKCSTCREPFVFTKEEQQHWYETLQIETDVEVKNCPPCRKKIRKQKASATKFTRLMENLDEQDTDQLTLVVDGFLERNNVPKAKFYLSKVRKIKGFKESKKLQDVYAALKEKIEAFFG